MLTYNTVDYEQDGNGAVLQEINGSCLSLDTKPTTGIVNGSVLTEMDTGTVYMFDQEHSTWIALD